MLQIRHGDRKTREPDETPGVARGAERRRVAKLAAAAVAGAVAGTETLNAPASAATLATVRGKVSGPGVRDFSHCVVMLYETTGRSRPHMKPVSATGHYQISGVPPGSWRAICIPGIGTPLTAVTYKGEPGYRYKTGTIIRITRAQTVYANFALPPAGELRVMARNRAAAPVSGAIVWVAEAGADVPALPPAVTDSTGTAILTHVPLKSKVLLVDPATRIGVWWHRAKSWSGAATITLPHQGAGISISVTLPEG